MNIFSKKKLAIILLITKSLFIQAVAEDAWVSDEIQAPMREKPELNAPIVSMLAAGQKVTIVEKNENYAQIKTADGQTGWLSDYYILNSKSVHAKLGPIEESMNEARKKIKQLEEKLQTSQTQADKFKDAKETLEQSANENAEKEKNRQGNEKKLNSDNILLQKKLSEQTAKVSELAKALDVAQEKASTAETRYLSFIKVSENVVEIGEKNKELEQKAIKFEQEVQTLKNENQTLSTKLSSRETLMAFLMVIAGILIGYVMSIMAPPRGRSSNYSSF